MRPSTSFLPAHADPAVEHGALDDSPALTLSDLAVKRGCLAIALTDPTMELSSPAVVHAGLPVAYGDPAITQGNPAVAHGGPAVALTNQIDPLLVPLMKSNPQWHAKYRAARIIIDRPGGHGSNDGAGSGGGMGATPAVPATPAEPAKEKKS